MAVFETYGRLLEMFRFRRGAHSFASSPETMSTVNIRRLSERQFASYVDAMLAKALATPESPNDSVSEIAAEWVICQVEHSLGTKNLFRPGVGEADNFYTPAALSLVLYEEVRKYIRQHDPA